MKFEEGAPLYSYDIVREEGEDVLYINYLGAPFVPSLADYPQVMASTLDVLTQAPNVSRIVFVQQKNYNYDFEETSMLLEISQLYTYLIKQERVLAQSKLAPSYNQYFPKRYNEIFSFLFTLKQDPISAYYDLKKLIMDSKILLDRIEPGYKSDQKSYLFILNKIKEMLENTKLIKKATPYLDTYQKGDREIYRNLFRPDTIPNFTFTRLVSDIPGDSEIIDQYKIGEGTYDEANVTILKREGEAKLLYHLNPAENFLSEEHYELLNLARGVLLEHQPKAEEFVDTERTRQVFFNISKDLLQDLANAKK